MRNYPRNSPEAAARIVALAMLADGHLSQNEVDALDRLQAHAQLGLARSELLGVLQRLCEDLLSTGAAAWEAACQVDTRTVAELLAEIDDPALRERVLQLCVAVVEADAHVADGEADVLVAAVESWGLQREMLGA